jgi:hypothetical protein
MILSTNKGGGMTLSLTLARQICSASELKLIQDSFFERHKQASDSRLRQLTLSARRKRDSLRKASAGRAERKAAQSQEAEATARQKIVLFDEALTRYEAELLKRQKAASPALQEDSKPEAERRKKKPSRKERRQKREALKAKFAGKNKSAGDVKNSKVKKKRAAAKGSPQSLGDVRAQKLSQRKSSHLRAHTRAAGRRQQKKRDAR